VPRQLRQHLGVDLLRLDVQLQLQRADVLLVRAHQHRRPVLSGHLIAAQGTLQKPMPLQPIGHGPALHRIVQKKPPFAGKSSQ
jgi:hypothetical protein